MTNSNINSENSSINCRSRYVHLWLITNESIVILKNIKEKPNISIEDMTICANDIKVAINEIEKHWKILCEEENLQKIYEFCSESTDTVVEGYLIRIHADEEFLDLLQTNQRITFVPYSELEDYISERTKKDEIEFNEAFYALLSKLNQ